LFENWNNGRGEKIREGNWESTRARVDRKTQGDKKRKEIELALLSSKYFTDARGGVRKEL